MKVGIETGWMGEMVWEPLVYTIDDTNNHCLQVEDLQRQLQERLSAGQELEQKKEEIARECQHNQVRVEELMRTNTSLEQQLNKTTNNQQSLQKRVRALNYSMSGVLNLRPGRPPKMTREAPNNGPPGPFWAPEKNRVFFWKLRNRAV